jgi:hypothetical protein
MVGGTTAAAVALSPTFVLGGNVETVSANRAHSVRRLLCSIQKSGDRLMAFPLLLSLYPTEMPGSHSVDTGGMNHGETHHCLAESKNY